jgi:hypothetical protein
VQIAALAAAVLIAFQIAADHWFYLYVVWFAPLVFVALFAAYERVDGGQWTVDSAESEPVHRPTVHSGLERAAAQ